MAVSVESLTQLCKGVQNCGLVWRPNRSTAIKGVQKFTHHCKIYCNGNRSPIKKHARQPFRNSSIEDALTTSWALYNYDDRKNKSASSKPTSHNPGSGYENSDATADDQQATTFVAGSQGGKGRRNSRVGNPSLSLSGSFDGQTNGAYIGQAMGPPEAVSKPLAGGAGLYMALVFALLGITTAGASLLGVNSSQEECTKCSGYGVERCHLCKCTGTIECELESVHIIPCPLCLGSCMKKCSSCNGVRIKKGEPPFLQQEQVKSSQEVKNDLRRRFNFFLA